MRYSTSGAVSSETALVRHVSAIASAWKRQWLEEELPLVMITGLVAVGLFDRVLAIHFVGGAKSWHPLALTSASEIRGGCFSLPHFLR
jgi:hypothetical protein